MCIHCGLVCMQVKTAAKPETTGQDDVSTFLSTKTLDVFDGRPQFQTLF